MNILKKIRDVIKKGFGGTSWLTRDDIMGGLNSDSYYNKYKSYAFACINLRAENVAAARINLYQDLISGKTKEIFEHPFLDLIRRENGKKQTFRNLLFRIQASLDLYGNAYLYINRDKLSSTGTPWDLYYLPYNNVAPVISSDLTTIESYRYTAGGTSVLYPAADIIHFQVPDPNSNLKGIGIIEGFNETLEIDFLQQKFQKNYFKNNAALGLVLETQTKLGDTEFLRLKDEINKQYEGAGKAGKTLLLENGLTAKPYTNTPKDSMFVQARQMIRDDVLSMFRVPKTLLGISDDVNLANANIALNMFTNYVIKPFVKMNIVEKFNSFLNSNYKGSLRVEFDYDTEVDRDMTLKSYEFYMKYNITTIDEIREMEGFSSRKTE